MRVLGRKEIAGPAADLRHHPKIPRNLRPEGPQGPAHPEGDRGVRQGRRWRCAAASRSSRTRATPRRRRGYRRAGAGRRPRRQSAPAMEPLPAETAVDEPEAPPESPRQRTNRWTEELPPKKHLISIREPT
ncbi:MAG: hypothetical protein MZV70_07280 [Desulfobacterales bacterium]|nr:hypothetical protein [Desulfobacterales bacterium]